MKLFIILIYTMVGTKLFSQTINDFNKRIDSSSTVTISDSMRKEQDSLSLREYIRDISINVIPPEASDASISIIRSSKIRLGNHSRLIEPITPESLGTWRAPLNINLFTGDYDLEVNKVGFREVITRIRVDYKKVNNISLEMSSLADIQQKQQYWRTIKWINGALAIGSAIVTYYIHSKINKYKEEYDNAISPQVILDNRESLIRHRLLYKIFSGIALTALSGFTASWLIEITL